MTTHLFDVVVTRHGGLPVEAVDELICGDLSDALRALQLDEQRLREAAEGLESALFDAVPRATSKDVRRRVLNLKRDVHNLRCGDLQDQWPELLELGIPEATLREWSTVCNAIHAAEQAILDRLTTTNDASRQAAFRALLDPRVLRTLALASPSFVEELITLQHAANDAPALKASTLARLDRTATAYLSRATLKTSPFGALGVVGQASFGTATADQIVSTQRATTVLANRALATDLIRAVARRPDGAASFDYEVNPSLFTAAGELLAAVPLRLDDFMWTQDVITDVGTLHPLIANLEPGEVIDYITLLDRLAAVGGFTAFQRLIDVGLITPVAPWARWATDPLHDLAEFLMARTDADANACARAVAAVASVHADAASPDLQRRLHGMRNLQHTTEQAYHELHASVPGWLTGVDVLHEDDVVGDTTVSLGPSIEQDLRTLGDYVSGAIFQTALYPALVDSFVAEFGTGGICRDPLAFAASFMRGPDSAAVLHEAMTRDAELMSHRRGQPAASRPPLPPGAVVFFQIAAAHRDAIDTGDYHLVINQLSPGLGGILARWCPSLDASGASMSQALRSWFTRAAADAMPVTIPLSADWNSLHHRSGALLDSFRWPSEIPTHDAPDHAHDLRNLSLVHDIERNAVLFKRNGTDDVAPVYLGTVPMHMVFGPARILYTLADPWIVPDPGSSVIELFGPKERVRSVIHQVRISAGRVVFRRARWIVPTKMFPLQEQGENDLRYARRAHAFWDEHQLPDELFISAETSGIEVDAKVRKPVWIHRNSIRSLQAAGAIVRSAELGVRLVEALPQRHEHWVRVAEGRVATEFVALLRWEDTR
jgi:hypothetical protein